MKHVPSTTIDTLTRFDTPTVCNVIELCDHRPRTSGTMNYRIESRYPHLPPMVGYAVTATFRSAQPAGPNESAVDLFNSKPLFDQIPGPRVVVIKDLDEPRGGAVYGEIMVRLLQAYGCVGLITDGSARDIHQVAELGFPCFTSGICATHANGRILGLNGPVTVGGVDIHPGDMIHGDANGITTVPRDIADRVAMNCQDYVDAEEELMEAITPNDHDTGRASEALIHFSRRLDTIRTRMRTTETSQPSNGLV
jgi:regulator of RNase E activity RraA